MDENKKSGINPMLAGFLGAAIVGSAAAIVAALARKDSVSDDKSVMDGDTKKAAQYVKDDVSGIVDDATRGAQNAKDRIAKTIDRTKNSIKSDNETI